MTDAHDPVPVLKPRDRLIVGLDVSSVEEARAMVRRLGDAVGFYKVGLELVCAGGIAFAGELVAEGKQVFLDLKMHDIPNTVSRATAQVAKIGATFLTIHAYPQTMRAAQNALGDSGLRLLGVTALTSADDADLDEAGYRFGVKELVARRSRQARDAGLAGVVVSAEEVQSLRALVGPSLLLVTPGIRPAGSEAGDQKRIMTPTRAIAAGADHLVVARPILHAADPRGAALAIIDEISAAAAQ